MAEFAAILRGYNVVNVVGDRYGSLWVMEQFHKAGVRYPPSERSKSELYLECLPMLTAGQCELLDVPRLAAQLCGLERRTSRAGRDSVDHGPGQHDDVANVACGALVLAGGDGAADTWRQLGAGTGSAPSPPASIPASFDRKETHNMPTTINASPRVRRELGLVRRRFTFRDRVNDSAYALAPGSELRVVAALPPLPPSGSSYDVRANNAGNWVVVLVPGVPLDNGRPAAAGDLDPLGVSGANTGRGRAAAADRARTADQLRRINAANRAAFDRPAQR